MYKKEGVFVFQVGDYVIYGYEGVCRVDEIGSPKLGGFDPARQYYRLCSLQRSNVIYAPVDGKIAMRRPLSASEADEILRHAADLPCLEDVPQDGRRAGDYYKAILSAHDPLKLMQLCKTMQRKQNALQKNRRSVNATEQRNWKAAEDLLLDELAFALQTGHDELRRCLQEKYAEE